jgi:hypothetical protein
MKPATPAAATGFVPGTQAAGIWGADPYGRYSHRYWNGTAWTDQVSTNGVQSVDPLGAAPQPPSA